ncbi:MAG: cache domain-containing protein [Patescibacteria group bacterium]|jgi:methyl-accepting chemotaxis protein
MPKTKTKKPLTTKNLLASKRSEIFYSVAKKAKYQCSFWMPLLLTAATVLFLVSFVMFCFVRIETKNQAMVYTFSAVKVADQDELIKTQVQTAVSILDGIYAKVMAEEMEEETAKKLAADILRNLRYGKDGQGYFFADTVEGINIVLPTNLSVEGTNRIDAKVNGVFHVREIIKSGQKPGGGFTDYYFVKPGGTVPLAKRSYSLEFKPFGWIIGTGYYLEDVVTSNYKNGWSAGSSCGFCSGKMMRWW